MNCKKITPENKKNISEYLKIYNCTPKYVVNSLKYPFELLNSDSNIAFIVNNKYLRKLAHIFGKKSFLLSEIQESAIQFLTLQETFTRLNKNNVPCYMFNRIAAIDESHYTDDARKRINKKLSFPKMLEEKEKYQEEFRKILGDAYSSEYIDKISKIPQVIMRGNVYGHEDYNSDYVNVIGGKRIVPDSNNKYARTIHIFGRCGVFGYAVEDKDNIPSKLQQILNNDIGQKFNIVNHGLWGGEDQCINHNIILESEHIKSNDIIIIYMKHYKMEELREYMKCGLYYYDITKDFHQYEESRWCFYDRPGHMTREGYAIVAKLIFKKLLENKFGCKEIKNKRFVNTTYRKKYLEKYSENEFVDKLNNYFYQIKEQYPTSEDIKTIGAIVMNCNPFTLGHRYLIDYASKKVDRLYIFVLEEDKSFFKFSDRFMLVKKGTEDFKNVIVLPSREFMISALTFPEYFMKDYVQKKEIDVTKDLSIFCEHIAPILGISIRFVGDEPIDLVTKRYNENMKNILPQYGLELIEIPRLNIEDGLVVSASMVRKLMNANNFDELKKYVPETTYDFLVENYSSGI